MEPSPQELRRAHLKAQLQLARRAGAALRESLAAEPKTEERMEALTARFARLADVLTQKVFRAVDALELEDEGSLIDRLNRMEKRGVIPSAQLWRDIRDIRNQIAHEYALDSLDGLHRAVLAKAPALLDALPAVEDFVRRRGLA